MKKRSARGTITREAIADAALAIADRDGLDGVTMRAIATEMGATPMALYTYFGDKDALYEGMRERIFAHASIPAASPRTWQAILETIARAVFGVMRDHPNWVPLMARGGAPPPSALEFFDEIIELMLKDGFALEDTIRAYACAMSFAVGTVLFERMMLGGGDVVSKRLALLKELLGRTPDRYANLSSVAAKVDRWSFDDVFDLGIRSLLEGIEAECVRRKPGPSRRSRRASARR